MNSNIKTAVVELLAETDALFWPLRRQGDEPAQAQLAGRYHYQRKGLPYRKTGDKLARSAFLRELEASGLVTVSRDNGRASHWKLADAGDEYARALVGLPGRRDCLKVMRRLVKLADAGHYLATTGDGLRYIREADLCGCTFDLVGRQKFYDAVFDLQNALAPAWPRRWTVSALTPPYGGHHAPLAHAITAEGMAALSLPVRKIKLPKADAKLRDLYNHRFVDFGEGWESARHKSEFAVWLQPYFTSCETISGTDAVTQKNNPPVLDGTSQETQ
jgi:hypothetical protein